jgi:hypothetical protein
LKPYDKLLKAFKYSAALDSVLAKVRQPISFVVTIREPELRMFHLRQLSH